ncbi:Serine-threonine/tyrosine-protein kinase, catalytic domain [Sesbania bispinosa]|nr:Serine-threonine/tyrosine-protein kinase, catalytic domain [Sesbania bispinosa]
MDKMKQKDEDGSDDHARHSTSISTSIKFKSVAAPPPPAAAAIFKKQREDWEIDPSNLIIKSVIARGTFGTVHRGIYDGQDVAVKMLDWGEEGHRTEAEIAALRSAFTQEVVVWHKLEHPNVTKFSGFYTYMSSPLFPPPSWFLLTYVQLEFAGN